MLDQFVKMTQRIIAEDGFDNYLPTLLLPATREVRVLDQVDGQRGRAAEILAIHRSTLQKRIAEYGLDQ